MCVSVVTNEDNMVMMSRYPDKYFDLAIVDPPYGINAPKMSMGTNKKRKGHGYPGESTADRLRKGRLNQGSGKLKTRALNTMSCEWDFAVPEESYFRELFRVSKNQIIWGGNYFNLPPTRGIAVWNKMQPWDNFSQCELAWTSFDVPAKLISLSNTGGANAEVKIHPTQKPVKLYKWLLKNYGQEGDSILDTHLGSESSRIVAHDMGFDFYGCELDEGYFNEGNKRYESHIKQLTLF